MIIVHIPSWFPHTEKPLDGNFILKQIATITPHATCILMHHSDNTQLLSELMPPDIYYEEVPFSKNDDKRKLWTAYHQVFKEIIIRYGKPDCIHLHVALPLGPVAAHLSKKYDIPLLISEHWSIYEPQNRRQLTIRQRALLHYTFQQAQGISTVSLDLRDSILDCVHASRMAPSFIISNVVDTDLFHPISDMHHRKKKQILHISSLENRSKNIMGILRAVETVSKTRNDFELNIIHDLPNPEVEQFIRERRLRTVIHLLGKKKEVEVAKALQRCDFLLQFSNYETQSCVLLESFAVGKPVITTPVGGIPEIANDRNAIFVEPRNEMELAQDINYMLDHFTKFNSNAIRNKTVKRYSKNIIGNQFKNFYHSLIIQ